MRDTTAFKAKQFESEDQRKAVFAALADGGEGETFTAWSKNLIDDVHHRGKSAPARFENVTADELQHFTQMEREICEVHFYPYLTVIKKRGT